MVRVSDGDHRASQSSDHQSTVKHSAGEKGGSVYQRSSQASQSTVQTSSSDSQAHDRSAKKAFESSKTSQGSASEGRNISVTDLSGKDSKDSHGVAGTSLVNNEEYSFPRDLQRSRIKRSGKEKFADAFQTKWSALKKRVSGEDSEGRLKSLQHDKKALERSTQSEEEHAYDRKRKKSLSLSDRFRDSKKRVQRGVGSSDVRTTSQAGVSSSRASSRSLHQRFASWTKNIFLKIDGRQEKRAALEGKGKHPQSRRGLRRSTDGDVDLFSEGYLRNMRPIGWKMRSKMDETYKKDAK
jgi:hypothetical protein